MYVFFFFLLFLFSLPISVIKTAKEARFFFLPSSRACLDKRFFYSSFFLFFFSFLSSLFSLSLSDTTADVDFCFFWACFVADNAFVGISIPIDGAKEAAVKKKENGPLLENAMGCCQSRPVQKSLASKNARESTQDIPKSTTTEKPAEEEADFDQFVAGYVADYPQKGTVTTYEDYKGYTTSTTNHMSKSKVDRLCKWADVVLQDRHRLNHDVFFNPQNPAVWPKEVLAEYTSAPSFADRHTAQQGSGK